MVQTLEDMNREELEKLLWTPIREVLESYLNELTKAIIKVVVEKLGEVDETA